MATEPTVAVESVHLLHVYERGLRSLSDRPLVVVVDRFDRNLAPVGGECLELPMLYSTGRVESRVLLIAIPQQR